jgi:hypothetical protein
MRLSVSDAIRVLVIVPERDAPVVRQSDERTESGPYALGFAMADTYAADERMTRAGVSRTLPAVTEYQLERRYGEPYGIHEASDETPDNTRLVALSRRGRLPQVGGIDAATGFGGSSYSSQIVDDPPAMERFFTSVLD